MILYHHNISTYSLIESTFFREPDHVSGNCPGKTQTLLGLVGLIPIMEGESVIGYSSDKKQNFGCLCDQNSDKIVGSFVSPFVGVEDYRYAI